MLNNVGFFQWVAKRKKNTTLSSKLSISVGPCNCKIFPPLSTLLLSISTFCVTLLSVTPPSISSLNISPLPTSPLRIQPFSTPPLSIPPFPGHVWWLYCRSFLGIPLLSFKPLSKLLFYGTVKRSLLSASLFYICVW